MTISDLMFALLNSGTLYYSEPLGKLLVLIDTGRATARLEPHGVSVVCRVTVHGHSEPIEGIGTDSFDAIKKAINIARLRNLL